MNSLFNPQELKKTIGSRQLFIWGCGHYGASFLAAMDRMGIEVSGFIDSYRFGTVSHGKRVYNPDEVLAQTNENVFIILASFLSCEALTEICSSRGFVYLKDYVGHTELKPYHFEIDVAGKCNLRCTTCPRGNSIEHPYDGNMTLESYKQVIDKLLMEVPFLSDVQLYSWGEPLLNPALPEMIVYTASKGVAVAISSNLSFRGNIEDVIKAKPAWFRVSVSGSAATTYNTVHAGGNISLVMDNMKKLAEFRSIYAPDMFVEINYHMYKHNLKEINTMKAYCEQLGFSFSANYAFIDSLDSIRNYVMHEPLSPVFRSAKDSLLIDIDTALRISSQVGGSDCVSENSYVIHSDLSFRRCTHFYADTRNVLTPNFLEVPLTEILEAAKKCSLCQECRSLKIHRYHFPYLNCNEEDLEDGMYE